MKQKLQFLINEENQFILKCKEGNLIIDKEQLLIYFNFKRNKKITSYIDFFLDYEKYIVLNTNFNNTKYYDLRKDNITKLRMKNQIYYDIDLDENYGIIYFNKNKILVDIDILFEIFNNFKNLIITVDDIYPYINDEMNLLDFLIKKKKGFKNINLDIVFKNKNNLDLRFKNFDIYHKYHKNMIAKYPCAIYIEGHFKNTGTYAYIMKNPMWKVNDIYYVYCKNDNIFKIDQKSLLKLKEYEINNNIVLTYTKLVNGYIMCSRIDLYVHQIITNCYGNGKGTKKISVDHIDQDPLNNCYDNLRIATRKIQEKNSKGIKKNTKRARKKSAMKLPDGLTHEMMPKYVYYSKEYLNKEKNKYRDFFRIEKHPNLKILNKKCLSSSKSAKFTTLQKLDQIKEKLKYLDRLNEE